MSKKPNILLIMTDQFRFDCIGCSGYYPVKTPNIDKLAAEGVWFENAYTPIPLCCPARQSLLNGRRPEAFGAYVNYDVGFIVSSLNPADYTWTNDLQKNGYKNGYFGKWHVNPVHNPTEYGFDYYIGNEHYEEFLKGKYPNTEYSNGYLGEKDCVPVEDSSTHWMAGKACELIGRYSSGEEPWHIRLDFWEPHLPCRPSGHFAEMYKPEDIPKWGSFIEDFDCKPYIQKQQLYTWNIEDYNWEDWAPIVARYYGIISQVDDAVGLVLRKLEEMGGSNETLVIFTSDHGDMCGSHRMIDKHYIMYDDVVRVPLIIRWPRKVSKGIKCKEFVYQCLDLPPTVLEAAEMQAPDNFCGKSLMGLLKEKNAEGWRQEILVTYNGNQFGLYTQRMIRDKTWKYVWNLTDKDELYKLDEDPDELYNLVDKECYSHNLKEMRIRLYHILIENRDGIINFWTENQLLNQKKI